MSRLNLIDDRPTDCQRSATGMRETQPPVLEGPMLFTENRLDEWVRGNSRTAQGVIVELVWRLVAAAHPRPRERRFPLGDSIGQHGPDGILEVDLHVDPFIPDGRSYWEIGTGVDAGAKATNDYRELTNATPPDERLNSTFVFVTPLSGRRDWEGSWQRDAQLAWLRTRRSSGNWKDVRVLDGTRLTDWLHQYPSVEIWLARKTLNLLPSQMETLEQHWEITQSIGEPPPLTPQVFLANRDEAHTKLKSVFDGLTTQIKFETHFPEQIVDFVAASLAVLDTESRADAAGRTLVISGVDAWNQIVAHHQEQHILIAAPSLDLNGDAGTRLIQGARRRGHAVIFAGPRVGIPDPSSVPLPQPRVDQLKDALKNAGYSAERARGLAHKSGGNLGSLLRCLQNLSLLPAWAETSTAADLAIAAALGSWNDCSEGDRNALSRIVGNSYGAWVGKLRELELQPGTPLTQKDGKWKFVARYEGWYALGSRLTDEDLQRLRVSIVSVLSERDPQFELSPEDRFAARVRGKTLACSELLRTGMAECLALLGGHPNALRSCTSGRPEQAAVLAVREILADADWRLWASLDSLLPLLAEAAPNQFLDTVERHIQTDPSPVTALFDQERPGFAGRSYMTGLLWALETLAWDADLLSRVLVCLAEIAAHDPGGQWANRPANSMATILLPWLPQTCAASDRRLAAVKIVLREQQAVGWKLLMELISGSRTMSAGTRRPVWREIIPEGWSQSVTHGEYYHEVREYAELAMVLSEQNPHLLGEIVGQIDHLPDSVRDRLLELLESDSVREMPDVERTPIWRTLVDVVTRHQKYADAGWAMSPEVVSRISDVAEQIAPKSPTITHARLFDESEFALLERRGDFQSQLQEISARREAAVVEIAASGGPDAVIEFSKSVDEPGRVGFAYGVVAADDADSVVIAKCLRVDDVKLNQMAAGFVRGRLHSRGWDWVLNIDASEWAPPEVTRFLTALPFCQEAWSLAERFLGENELSYWTATSANFYEATMDTTIVHAIDMLIENGRPHAAIRCIRRASHEKVNVGGRLKVRALLAAATSVEPAHSVDVWDMVELIKELQRDPALDPDDLARVEWAYLPVLDDHKGASARLLQGKLANQPQFFCEVIQAVFRPQNAGQAADVDMTQSNDETHARAIAENGYRLLSKWSIPPGAREDGALDGDAFMGWLRSVKATSAASGHERVAMTMLGHVLIRTPADPDGLWIHRTVASALNARDGMDMRDGYRTALYNSRGVHHIDPTGAPERELARKYRTQAQEVEFAGFQRLAATLRDLAETYEREAEHPMFRDPFED